MQILLISAFQRRMKFSGCQYRYWMTQSLITRTSIHSLPRHVTVMYAASNMNTITPQTVPEFVVVVLELTRHDRHIIRQLMNNRFTKATTDNCQTPETNYWWHYSTWLIANNIRSRFADREPVINCSSASRTSAVDCATPKWRHQQ